MEMEAKEIVTRAVGLQLVLASLVGLFFNFSAFHRFVTLEKSSFNILCSSKTVSNSLSLLIYLCYLGPTHLFYTSIGSVLISSYINQALGFGLYIQGPLTQMLITINRFLVVWFTPTTTPSYSNPVTVVVLLITWTFVIYFSTLIGFPADCLNPFSFDSPGSRQTVCNRRITWYMVYCVFFLTIFNNFLNVVMAGKLVWTSKYQRLITSDVVRKRRQQTIRFFVQTCIQDWIFVLDIANNLFLATLVCSSQNCRVLMTFAFDVLVYGVDGLVMFLFNNKGKSRRIGFAKKSVTEGNRNKKENFTVSRNS